MSNRVSALRDAARQGRWILRDLGRELRVARIAAGMTQREVGRLIGRSASHVSRVEHGRTTAVPMPALAAQAAAVGLKPWFRLFPAVHRPMDAPQLATLHRFRERISPAWSIAVEVPVPVEGNLRAADAVISIPDCRCLVEVITRLADWQMQVRAARLKHRDLKTDRLILVVADTTTNRRQLRGVPEAAMSDFPLRTRDGFVALRTGDDPGANAILLV
jgi:transcriptional regulator with XRE-family HTH domain